MASLWYNRAKSDILKGTYNLSTATLKLMLVQTGYVADADHDFVSSITGGPDYELNSGGGGSGYTAGFAGSGRKTLASLTVTEDDTNNRASWDAADVTWTAINAGTARAGVIYKAGTADSDSAMLCYIQFPSDVVTNGGDLTISWSASGISLLT